MKKAGGRFAPLRGGMDTATGKTLTSETGGGGDGTYEMNPSGVGGSISITEVSQRNSHKAIGEPRLPSTRGGGDNSNSNKRLYYREIAQHLTCAIELDPKCSKIIRSMGEGAKAALRGVNSKSNGPGEIHRRDKSEDSSRIRDSNVVDLDGMEDMYADGTEDSSDDDSDDEDDAQEIIGNSSGDDDNDNSTDDDEGEDESRNQRFDPSSVQESSVDQSRSGLQDASNGSQDPEVSTGADASSSGDVDMSLS